MSYIHFTEEQRQQANQVDLEQFLQQRGERLIRSGREYRLESDHSVTIQGNEWFDHASGEGGLAIRFVQRQYGLSYPEAVMLLLDGQPAALPREKPQPKPFALPERNRDMRRVFGYLVKQRGIEPTVVSHFEKAGTLYEDADHHNAVFAGTDEQGVFRHAHKRSSYNAPKVFRLNVEGSDPRYSFHHLGTDGRLYVFEAPIDMLSFITLHPEDWQRHSYVACCGTSLQPVRKMLERMEKPEKVFLCLDNDKAGEMASTRMQAALGATCSVERLLPEGKDWNDDLLARYGHG